MPLESSRRLSYVELPLWAVRSAARATRAVARRRASTLPPVRSAATRSVSHSTPSIIGQEIDLIATVVCPASHTCGDAEGTCHPPTVTTTLETTLRTTSTMTTTATIALAPVNGPNYGPGPAQTPPPLSTPTPDINSTLPTIPDASSAPPIVTPTPAPTESEPIPTNPPANGSQPAIIETPSVPLNTTSTSSAVIDAGTSSSEDGVTTSTSFVTPTTSYTTRTESQASDTAGASATPTTGRASRKMGIAQPWFPAIAAVLGVSFVQYLT